MAAGDHPTKVQPPKPNPALLAAQKLQAEQAASNASRQTMMQDVEAGRQFGQSVIGEGSLGRLDEAGLSSEALSAARGQATERIQGMTQTNLRALKAAQGAQGVSGATALSQQQGVLSGGAQQQSQFERDLLLRQNQEQKEAKQFNLAQSAKERFAQLSSGLGFAQIGASERGAKAASQAQAAAANQGGGGNTYWCTELLERGLVSKEDYDMIHECMYKTFMFRGKAWAWYIDNGIELRDLANANNFDWAENKQWIFNDTLDAYKEGDLLKAELCYAAGAKRMAFLFKPEVWDESIVENRGIISSLKYLPKIITNYIGREIRYMISKINYGALKWQV